MVLQIFGKGCHLSNFWIDFRDPLFKTGKNKAQIETTSFFGESIIFHWVKQPAAISPTLALPSHLPWSQLLSVYPLPHTALTTPLCPSLTLQVMFQEIWDTPPPRSSPSDLSSELGTSDQDGNFEELGWKLKLNEILLLYLFLQLSYIENYQFCSFMICCIQQLPLMTT